MERTSVGKYSSDANTYTKPARFDSLEKEHPFVFWNVVYIKIGEDLAKNATTNSQKKFGEASGILVDPKFPYLEDDSLEEEAGSSLVDD